MQFDLNDGDKIVRKRERDNLLVHLGWLVVFITLLLTVTVWADECPADRPHRIELRGSTWCTLLACIGPLKCADLNDSGLRKCWREQPATDCNICTQEKIVACISDDDLKAARRP